MENCVMAGQCEITRFANVISEVKRENGEKMGERRV